jgi:hypothetical protein
MKRPDVFMSLYSHERLLPERKSSTRIRNRWRRRRPSRHESRQWQRRAAAASVPRQPRVGCGMSPNPRTRRCFSISR